MANLKDYIEDRKFVNWALEPDAETEAYFLNYLNEHPDEKAGLLKARGELKLLAVDQKTISADRKSTIYKQITSYNTFKQASRTILVFRRTLPYAAVAILFFALGILAMNQLKENYPVTIPESLLVKSAALNTMVYLADGSKKEVGNAKTLIDFSQKGVLLVGTDTIQLTETERENSSNMVVVPFGKRALIRLHDESLIELKAGSRILIPEKFSDDHRSAYLSGEAYFDITKDPQHPFHVNTSSTEIKVLGTSFRVEAYPDLAEQTTFLKEGTVFLRSSGHSLLSGWKELKPDEQAVTHASSNKIIISKGDSVAYSLWKKGIVQLNNEPVEAVVKQVERYFNISIQLPDQQIRNRLLTGKMNLDTELNEVFKYLEKITDGKIEKVNAGEFVLK